MIALKMKTLITGGVSLYETYVSNLFQNISGLEFLNGNGLNWSFVQLTDTISIKLNTTLIEKINQKI